MLFTNVVVASTGTYVLTVHYVHNNNEHDLNLTVGVAGDPAITISVAGKSKCCSSAAVNVLLSAGSNTVTLGYTNGHAPSIDKIVISAT